MAEAIKCDVCHNFFEYKDNIIRKHIKLNIAFQEFNKKPSYSLSFDVCGTCAGKVSLNHFYLFLNGKLKEEEIKKTKGYKMAGINKATTKAEPEITWKESASKRERK